MSTMMETSSSEAHYEEFLPLTEGSTDPEEQVSQANEEEEEDDDDDDITTPSSLLVFSNDIKLGIAFVLMVIVGTACAVLNKLVAIPLYNYPNFLNLFSLVAYLVLCVSYILPTIQFGKAITQEQRQVPKRTFAFFGCLDTLSIGVQTFASVYLSGPLLIMLPQAAIPFSMIFSKHIKGERFHLYQYIGAIIVLIGIGVVIEPMFVLSTTNSSPEYICQTNSISFDTDQFCTLCEKETTQESCLSHVQVNYSQQQQQQQRNSWNDTPTTTVYSCEWVQNSDNDTTTDQGLVMLWSLVVILSCIPMTISSLYKELTLQDVELDPLYLNGWTAFFQFFFSLALAVPAGMLTSPPLPPREMISNLKDGWNCYYHAQGSIHTGCHPDDLCYHAFWMFNLNFVMVVSYTVLAIYLLKYGSTSLLYLAFTITVPLGNIIFSIPSIPGYSPMHLSDVLGLIVIVTGLVLYRSAAALLAMQQHQQGEGPLLDHDASFEQFDTNNDTNHSISHDDDDDDKKGIVTTTRIGLLLESTETASTTMMESLQEPLLPLEENETEA